MEENYYACQWFEERGIKDYDIVMSNPKKGRLCYSFIDGDGIRRFLKWNNRAEEYAKHRSLMEKEEKIYKLIQKTNIAPCYIGGGMFVTEYVDGGETLRKKIKALLRKKDDATALSLLQRAFQKWSLFRGVLEGQQIVVDKQGAEILYNHYLMSLLVSGPIERKKNSFINYRNRLLLFLFRLNYNRDISHLLDTKILKVVHGDFHLNNIIVNRAGNVYLLDFENVKTGNADVELAYMVAQIRRLSEASRGFADKVDSLIHDLSLVDDMVIYTKVLDIYCKAVNHNPRFK